jgi:DNA-directed RNA polymerase specialized sigma24 family protein
MDAPAPDPTQAAPPICRSCPIPLPSASSRAFAELMPELRRTARRLTRSPEDADDLLQETLLRVWARVAVTAQGASDAAPVTDLRAYAFATLRNAAARRGPRPFRSDDERRGRDRRAARRRPAHLAMRDALAALDALPPVRRGSCGCAPWRGAAMPRSRGTPACRSAP